MATARGRFARTTSRERLLLGALALGAAVAAPLLAQGWAARRMDDVAENGARLQALRAEDDAGRLRGVASRLTDLDARVRAWSPAAASFATARVLAEQDVAIAAARAGATALEVRAAEAPDALGPARFVRVEVSCAFSWSRLSQLLAQVAATRPGAIVQHASTEGRGEEARLHLVLLAPFREASV